ncbi:hypothetical protein B2G71_06900 [Novosphingobium sp. PC22D]|uniref:hypothetical protein n=1 Tax=Novosphingobium sp. PC22D TaxID=1962403 RepID=UPI000BEF3333|nr:hypothetical protein [Novosphingobium sp. PC22D]PEQ13172.1 hypothetical protein B2G71_06900 [Novosphingobium sp. PC22D]
MRNLVSSIAAAALTVGVFVAATGPASANEARVEARGGVVWNGNDNSEAVAGLAAGYDFDLGDTLFAGPEVSAEKILDDDTRVSFGFGGRVGAKLGEKGRLFVASTWQTKPCAGCEEFVTLGGGYQHKFAGNLYGKVEYRHLFVGDGFPDADTAFVGLGMTF